MNVVPNSIESLIEKLIYLKQFNTNTNIVSCIFNMDMLIVSLKELNNMIGLNSVKNSIVIQIKYIIFQKVFSLSDSNVSLEHNILHTILYGPPGVGKTKIGMLLCKIWMSLGIIRINNTKNVIDPLLIINNVQSKLSYILQNNLYNNSDSIKLELNLLLDYISNYNHQNSNINNMDFNPENYIKIVNRDDFISNYLGQTYSKTKKLLNDCRGKILFIDESYSLVSGEKDSYGQEALSVLNEFMSKYPNEIIVIFTGYKDKLDETIFLYQPGLKRRCKWNFNVNSYTPIELSHIFIEQLNSSNWSLDSSIDISHFFSKNISYFPSFGGDTLKLAYDCKLCHSEYIFNNNFNIEHQNTAKIISFESFNKGFDLYLANFNSSNHINNYDRYSIYI